MNTHIWIVAALIVLAYLLHLEFSEILRNHFVKVPKVKRYKI